MARYMSADVAAVYRVRVAHLHAAETLGPYTDLATATRIATRERRDAARYYPDCPTTVTVERAATTWEPVAGRFDG